MIDSICREEFSTGEMENVENQSFKANRPVGYCIQFEPEKPCAPVPKCVTDYCIKPTLSPQELQQKMDQASLRRKARVVIMHTMYIHLINIILYLEL